MTVDWDALAGLEADDLQQALLRLAEDAMHSRTPEDADILLAALPEPMQVVWLLSWLDFEVSQGSFLAYFFNLAGRHSQRAVSALGIIGAPRMADVLRRALDAVSRADEAWTERRREVSDLGEHAVVTPYAELAGADELERLTDEYWLAASEEQWGEKLDRYLKTWVRNRARGQTN